MIDVKLLQTFFAVARYRHFGRAAEALGATQPGVSQHITKLEDYLKVKLISRSSRAVELTSCGELLLRRAKRLVDVMGQIEQDVQREFAGLRQRINIGLSTSALYSNIPGWIADSSAVNADRDVNIQVLPDDDASARLDWGEVDAIITPNRLEGSDYLSAPICRQPLGVALNSRNPLAGKAVLRFEDLVDEPFVLAPADHNRVLHDALNRRFDEIGASLRVACYEPSFTNLLARIAVGQGIALVGQGYRGDDASPLRVIPLDDPVLSQLVIFIVARQDNLGDPVQRFINHMTDSYRGTALA